MLYVFRVGGRVFRVLGFSVGDFSRSYRVFRWVAFSLAFCSGIRFGRRVDMCYFVLFFLVFSRLGGVVRWWKGFSCYSRRGRWDLR